MTSKNNRSTDSFMGLLFLLGGIFLLLWGLSYFLLPLATLVGGFVLINYGLKLRNMPPLNYWFRYWFLKLQ